MSIGNVRLTTDIVRPMGYSVPMAARTAYTWIVKKLAELDISQGELADRLGIDRGNFNRVFKASGKSKLRKLSSDEAKQIAAILDMPVEWVVSGKEVEPLAAKNTSKDNQLTGTETAITDCIKIIFKAIVAYGICTEDALIQVLSYQQQEYANNHDAQETMRMLQEFVRGKPYRSEKEIIGRLLHIRPLGSA